MNLNLMDPKLIVLAVAVVLIIAALAWLYVRKRRGTTAGFDSQMFSAVIAITMRRDACYEPNLLLVV